MTKVFDELLIVLQVFRRTFLDHEEIILTNELISRKISGLFEVVLL